jgi:hypothetical protein
MSFLLLLISTLQQKWRQAQGGRGGRGEGEGRGKK